MKTYKERRLSEGPSKVPGSICDSMLLERSLQGISEDGKFTDQGFFFFSNTNQIIRASGTCINRPPIEPPLINPFSPKLPGLVFFSI